MTSVNLTSGVVTLINQRLLVSAFVSLKEAASVSSLCSVKELEKGEENLANCLSYGLSL